ncbi:hypothetical protein [Nocardioides sp. YR527]|uniref:hypothetical protein n=1 Tax=Nocardioides sp. YR527 TaxID=1881028 RepID=UPI00115FEE25|nr:hypothetical protein [Nocardioides sp. YR527]
MRRKREEVAAAVVQVLTRRSTRLNLGAAVAFVLGGSLFALGAAFAQLEVVSLPVVNLTYLVGGCFFTFGGYLSILLADDTDTDKHRRRRGFRQRPRSWLSAFVLFVGTLFFAVSLLAAFAAGLTPRQSDGWIWLPDMTGCVCFLASGHLAQLDVGEGRVRILPRLIGWWVVAVNQLGSVLFFLAGLAAFIRPATSSAINVGLVNWGTFAGAVCFAVGGVIQAIDTPTTTRTVVQP